MPSDRDAYSKSHFFGAAPAEFDAELRQWGWPAFRGKQVRNWVYAKLTADPARMSNLAMRDRDELSAKVAFNTSEVQRRQDSSDGTRKLLLAWPGGAAAETVMIPDADRRTACVSSQVGCPV